MATVIHITEVGAILAVAYALGWAIGYFAHRFAASRPRRVEAPAEIAAAIAAASEADALVKVPVIEPVSKEPPPAAPQPPPVEIQAAPSQPEVVPVAAELQLAPPAEVVPAAAVIEPSLVPFEPAAPVVVQSAAPESLPKPIKTTLPPMDIPAMPEPPPLRIEPLARKPKPVVIPDLEPLPEPEPTTPFTATPALRPGEAWSGAIRGRAAAVPAKLEPEPTAADFSQPPIEVPVTLELTETIAFVAEPDSVAAALEPVVAVLEPESAPATLPSSPPHDEDAAMRAIEGGWSRVKARALPNSPELSDVGAAVAAAQTAVEQVLAQAGIDAESSPRASKPTGLAVPRAGRKDDLKRINGLGALDESTLNNLGVYHFEQIAGWDDLQVLWMESHVFARGRIGRENWQQQARDLAAAVAG